MLEDDTQDIGVERGHGARESTSDETNDDQRAHDKADPAARDDGQTDPDPGRGSARDHAEHDNGLCDHKDADRDK